MLGSVKTQEAIKDIESLEKGGENKHQERGVLWVQTKEEQTKETVESQ